MNSYAMIIPHKNNVGGLKRLLESIFLISNTPDFKNFLTKLSVIVVDDYSENNIFVELQNLKNNFNFILKQNTGKPSAGSCRNIGLSCTNADYVFFVDSDDYMVKDYYKVLLKYDDTKSDIIFFSPTSVWDGTNQISNRHIPYVDKIKSCLKDKTKISELRYTWLGPWSKRFSNNFIKENKILFDEVIASNDVMFSTVSGHKAKTLLAVDEIFYCLTRRQGSLIYSYSEEIIKARVGVGLRYKEFCDKAGFYAYKDHCINHLMRGIVLGPKVFLKLLRFAKQLGVFKDKKYAFKYVIRGLASNLIVFGNQKRKSLLKIS